MLRLLCEAQSNIVFLYHCLLAFLFGIIHPAPENASSFTTFNYDSLVVINRDRIPYQLSPICIDKLGKNMVQWNWTLTLYN